MAADGPTPSPATPIGTIADFGGRFIDGDSVLYRKHHRELFAYWSARRPATGRLPARRDIDPCDIPHLLSSLWMTDVVNTAGTQRFRERLVGTALVSLFGFDSTGRWFEDIYEDPHLKRQLATYRGIVAAARPHLSRLGVPRADREFLVYDRLILPLANDGTRPDILLGIHCYGPEPGEIASDWPTANVDYALKACEPPAKGRGEEALWFASGL